jgi:hypothetical protein
LGEKGLELLGKPSAIDPLGFVSGREISQPRLKAIRNQRFKVYSMARDNRHHTLHHRDIVFASVPSLK